MNTQRKHDSIYVTYTNIYGDILGKLVPVSQQSRIFEQQITFSCIDVDGLGTTISDRDVALMPDYEHAKYLSLSPSILWVPCFLVKENEKLEFCPRHILKSIIETAKSRDMGFNIGIEIEFTLLDGDTLAPIHLQSSPIRSAYDVSSVLELGTFFDEITFLVEENGYSVESINHEGGRGQYEISVRYCDPIKAVDCAFLIKLLVKQLAARHGWIASFMPKLYVDDFGSSAQINISAYSNKTKNEIDMSVLANRIIKHSPGLFAFTCPTYNSYKRFFCHSKSDIEMFTPHKISCGVDDRTALIRIVSKDRRLEYRASDFSGNMYLSVAALIAACLDGDNQSDSCVVSDIPITHLDAIKYLLNDEYLTSVLGKNFCMTYSNLMKDEWMKEYLNISDEERRRFVNV